MPRNPTSLQRLASQRNGLLGGRPRKTKALERARAIQQKARELGSAQALENLKMLLQIRDDGSLDMGLRLQAAIQIEDRYGAPRQQNNLNVNIDGDGEPPKLFELRQFEPPDTWNEKPTTDSEASVVEEDGPDE